MRIAIDISQIVYGTGVSQYTTRLVDTLLQIDRENNYILFAGALRKRKDILKLYPQAKVFPLSPKAANILWNRLHILSVESLIGRVDVVHTSDWAEPPSKIFKVTTVHDLIPLKFPKLLSKKIVETHVRKLRLVKKESNRIIVPSLSTKNDLIDFGVGEDRIRVIPEAPVMHKANHSRVVDVKRKYKISDDYIVAFASAPYKNTERIIKAFDLSMGGKNMKLVLVGRQTANPIKPKRNIRITGYLSDEELSALITGSKALVFASLYEGFGQPILEAFKCGVPVVTSNISSMPEVAGEAAALVDPYDVSSIKEGIETVLRGPKGFIEKGNKRIEEFSWEKTARMTLEVYKESEI